MGTGTAVCGITFKHAFDQRLLQPAITGKISHNDWLKMAEHSLSACMDPSHASRLVSVWHPSTCAIDFELLGAFRALAKTAPLLLITNATNHLDTDLTTAGLSTHFDHIANSSKLGSAKPDREIFAAALQMVGCEPREAVFIDDSKTNVLAAAEYTFRVIHY